MITQAELKEVLHYNPETGVFTWRVRAGTRGKVGNVAGCIGVRGYIYIKYNRVNYRAHRLAHLYMTGVIPEEVDHENHIKHDNRWFNLLGVNHLANCRNKSLNKNNTSGVAGVGWSKSHGKWQAYVTVDKKLICLGFFNTIEEAVPVRKAAELKYNFHKNHGVKHVSSNN